ncbi:MAG: serine/threonine-protein kinase [Bacteroidota bacterium]
MQDPAHNKAPSREQWQAVEQLFLKALELPTDKRAAFLDDACVADTTLREELDSLLAAHDEQHGFLDEMDASSAVALMHDMQPEAARTYGAYQVVREIGRGGMGKVYLAERRDGQFSQQVALKVVKGGLDTAGISQRFLQERQILAQLQHPNIARLLDGGLSTAGDPYFVMEYIDGQPLLMYCDAQRLSVDARIRLFVKVCEAVQYAHQNLIVHRDLKPGNILVTPAGDVKLLDFGIAKLIADGEMEAPEPLTETGFKAMTPEYASPEQVRAEVITTATDVYALGVILYEMLVGCRPYQFDRRSMQEVVQAICINEPARPLRALDLPALNLHPVPQIAANRGLSMPRLQRTLKGDVEAILLKALQKESSARYATVQAIREDLERYLARLPVKSRAGSLGYVFNKFIRRHRFAVAGLGLFILCLAVFSIVLGVQANRLAAERDRSQREAEKAVAVADFLESILSQHVPHWGIAMSQ